MENNILYQFPRNRTETVCASLRDYKQRKYIDLRIFYRLENSSETKPTKKGITLGVEFLPELKKALEVLEKEALSQADKMELK